MELVYLIVFSFLAYFLVLQTTKPQIAHTNIERQTGLSESILLGFGMGSWMGRNGNQQAHKHAHSAYTVPLQSNISIIYSLSPLPVWWPVPGRCRWGRPGPWRSLVSQGRISAPERRRLVALAAAHPRAEAPTCRLRSWTSLCVAAAFLGSPPLTSSAYPSAASLSN